jgi:hypothetical protein
VWALIYLYMMGAGPMRLRRPQVYHQQHDKLDILLGRQWTVIHYTHTSRRVSPKFISRSRGLLAPVVPVPAVAAAAACWAVDEAEPYAPHAENDWFQQHEGEELQEAEEEGEPLVMMLSCNGRTEVLGGDGEIRAHHGANTLRYWQSLSSTGTR